MKSQLGRTILWKVAQAGAKSKAAAKGTWGTLEVWTLLMFCIWWPCKWSFNYLDTVGSGYGCMLTRCSTVYALRIHVLSKKESIGQRSSRRSKEDGVKNDKMTESDESEWARSDTVDLCVSQYVYMYCRACYNPSSVCFVMIPLHAQLFLFPCLSHLVCEIDQVSHDTQRAGLVSSSKDQSML